VPTTQGQFTIPELSGICLSQPGTGLIRCTGTRGSLRLASPNVGLATRGVVEAVEGELIAEEELGVSTGVAGQVFALRYSTSLSSLTPEIEVTKGSVTRVWTMVESFAASGPKDRHFMVDATRGRILFSPDLRHGQAPPAGAVLRVPLYHHSAGGALGNVPARSISVLRSPRPDIASVVNESPAVGGADPNAMPPGEVSPAASVFPTRSVMSAAECQQFVLTAGLGVARARCLPAQLPAGNNPTVRLRILMLARPDPLGRLTPGQLTPTAEELEAVRWHLLSRIPTGVQVDAEGFDLVPVSTKVTVRALTGTPRRKLEEIARSSCAALHRYFNPLPGSGPDQRGWHEGRVPTAGDCRLALEGVPGIEGVTTTQMTFDTPQLGQYWLLVSHVHHVTCTSADGTVAAEFEA
jgi:predicted phage baseplate assembly protein